MSIPVIVGITTLPSRIARMRPCLDSLLAGEVVPDKIVLSLPKISRREQCGYELPDFLKALARPSGKVEINTAREDFGPGTKVLGALDALPQPCYFIAADDDVRYRPGFLSGLLQAQRADHQASFSYHTYRAGGLPVGQGCDGFSFHSPNLRGVDAFYGKHIAGTDLFYHDDLWLSYFLFLQGIEIRSLAADRNGGLIYEKLHEINSLNSLTGPLARKELNQLGLRHLLQATKPDLKKRTALKARHAYDQAVTSPLRRLKRKAGQWKQGLRK